MVGGTMRCITQQQMLVVMQVNEINFYLSLELLIIRYGKTSSVALNSAGTLA